ncbi:MAG: hypothetical protein ACRC41_17470, partial [Sarcina sp.]
ENVIPMASAITPKMESSSMLKGDNSKLNNALTRTQETKENKENIVNEPKNLSNKNLNEPNNNSQQNIGESEGSITKKALAGTIAVIGILSALSLAFKPKAK